MHDIRPITPVKKKPFIHIVFRLYAYGTKQEPQRAKKIPNSSCNSKEHTHYPTVEIVTSRSSVICQPSQKRILSQTN